MAETDKILNTKILLRNDLTENWSNANPKLSKGEVGIEFTNEGKTRVKIGNGTENWDSLGYFGEFAKTAVDESTIKYNEAGALTLVGYAEAETGARLQRTANGIAWVKPGEDDGSMSDADVKEAIEGLQSDVTSLGGKIEALEGADETLTGRIDTLDGKVAALETQDGVLTGRLDTVEQGLGNVYTKAETDSAIASAVTNASHLKRLIVTSLPTENIDENTIYMILREGGAGEDVYNEYMYINSAWEVIGNTQVDLSEYAKTADILVKEVDSANFTVESGRLTLNDLAIAKVTGLQDALEAKVAKEDGKSLIETTLIEKLSGMAEIKEVDTASGLTFADGKLAIGTVPSANVEGLPAALTDIDNLKTAQSSYIKTVSVGGTLLEAVEQGVNIPVATSTVLGVVKSATGEGKVSVGTDGTMSVESFNVNKLTQTQNEWLVLNGGNANLDNWTNQLS